MATFVLVHGGGHGGWCYKKVARLLRAAGHDVYAPTLTGLGERRHLLGPHVDLDLHITDVVETLVYEDLSDVVLAGHSYGGMVITGVADRVPERIRELVYLDAAHPLDGQSLADNAVEMMALCQRHIVTRDGVELIEWPATMSAAFFGVSDPEDAAWTDARLHTGLWKTYAQKLHLKDEARVRAIPRTDIDCTRNVRNWDEARRAIAASATRAWQIDTGHDLMLTEPALLAEMLLKLV
jgi:pimeloyl-ACP methyl ester carboxylesterase